MMALLLTPPADVSGMSIVGEHIAWCYQRNLRPTTIHRRKLLLERATVALGPLDKVTAIEWQHWFVAQPGGAATRNVYLSNLRSFYKWAIEFEYVTADPTVRIPRARTQRGLPRPISEADLERVLRAPAPLKAWLTLAAYAGLRACEIANLRGEDLRRDLGVLVVMDGKGGKARTIPLHKKVAAVIPADATGYLFLARSGGPVTANYVSVGANRWLRAHRANATLHGLRHRFASQVYAVSSDIRVTQELLGHSSPSTTAVYAAWSPVKAARAVAAI